MLILVQLSINLITFLSAIFLVYWSTTGNMQSQINMIFEHHKVSTIQQQADHLADITYYYALYIILLSMTVNFIRFFRKQFNQVIQGDSKIVAHINHLIKNSSQHLLLFVSIYVYLLQKHGLGMKRNSILLLPFWFFVGRIFTFLELLVNRAQSFIKFFMIGSTLSVVPFIFMIVQIAGYSPFKYFQ